MVRSDIILLLTLLSLSHAINNKFLENTILPEASNPYIVTKVTTSTYGIVALAELSSTSYQAAMELVVQNLTISIQYDTNTRVRIKITDTDNERWEVPIAIPTYSPSGKNLQYTVSPIVAGPLSIQVTRNSDKKVVFDLNPTQAFFYNNQDIGFSNYVGYPINVMGLGERVSSFILAQGNYTLYSRDRGSPIDYGNTPDSNMYSSQPFYLAVDEDFAAHGALLLNSNAMTATVGADYVGFRTTGGIIDFYVFIGPDPESVINQYHDLIGYPVLVPWWGLGWHQCRYGFQNISVVEEVTNDYTHYDIPLDVMWIDIDYMNEFQDFTLNPETYPLSNFTKWINQLKSANKHFVPITDAGIGVNPNYQAYLDGLKQNLYIQSAYVSGPTQGVVWPGTSVFIDYFHPNATDFWVNQMLKFEKLTSFSGIWIDMNEASNFITGEVGHPPSIITNLTMPYTPGEDVNMRSLDVASKHYGGILEYDVHNLFGFTETIATYRFFEAHNLRPFIITRSSFVGTGRYAGKWSGDNKSLWSFLEYSISGIYNFGMFGMPFSGADICGFQLNTTEEMCSRWTQLGALYPFSRNHNAIDSINQYPWSFGSQLLETSNLAIRNKYWLMLYFSTEMFKVSQNGGIFFKPAFFEYPNDANLLINDTEHFMLGKGLIVHPCLWEGIDSKYSYFPDDIWYDLYYGNKTNLDDQNSAVLDMTLPGDIPIHVRGGHIIPTLDNYDTVLDVQTLRKSPITLIVALDQNGKAQGDAVFDDGVTLDTLERGIYTQIHYYYWNKNATTTVLTIQTINRGYKLAQGEFPYISTITIYGINKKPQSVQFYRGGTYTPLSAVITFDTDDSVCTIWFSKSESHISPDRYDGFIFNFGSQ